MPKPATLLNYLPCRPRARRYLGATLFTVLIFSTTAAWRFTAPTRQRAGVLYTQHRSRVYEASNEQVVYECTKDSAVPSATGMQRWTDPLGGTVIYRPALPHVVNSFTVGGAPPLSDDFGRPLAMLFLHELVCGGRKRIVTVQRPVVPVSEDSLATMLLFDLAEPASWDTAGKVHWRGDVGIMQADGGQLAKRAKTWRFYAGQADHEDPSHFTISFAVDGQEGTIDGWLTSKDRLRLVLRP